MQKDNLSKLERAKKKVEKIKGFYSHLTWYIIVNLAFIFIEFRIYDFFNVQISVNEGFKNWMNWNFFVTPVLWGIGLAIHGLSVFRHKFKFFVDWEKRQIEKNMQEDNHTRWE